MKKFNIYNFTSSKMQAALTGVYHDNGYKVASDAIVLVAIKSDYPEELEHHIIDKDGKDVPSKYPHWKSCIPDGRDYKPYRIDPAQFEAFLKERRAAWKASEGKGTKWGQYQWTVKVGPACLKAHKFETFLSAMKEIGATEILVYDARHTVYAKTDKGAALIFPVLYAGDGTEPDILIMA